jgi:hypothetical protein
MASSKLRVGIRNVAAVRAFSIENCGGGREGVVEALQEQQMSARVDHGDRAAGVARPGFGGGQGGQP